VPPGPARWKPSATQIETGENPEVKYGPDGEAMSRYSTCRDGRTPRNASEANMYGRRYSVDPGLLGTHSTSVRVRASIEARKSSSLSSGSASRRAEAANRAAFTSGRNAHTDPSSCR